MGPSRREVVSLYRSIISLHKQKLSMHQQQVGNVFARGEFKRHKDADPRFLKQFIQEWSKYRDQLRDMSSKPGRTLSEEEVNALSPEQKEQLRRLHDAAKDLHRDG